MNTEMSMNDDSHAFSRESSIYKKIVTDNDLQKAINKVRRDRLKMREDDLWEAFCIKEIDKYNAYLAAYRSTDDGIQNIDENRIYGSNDLEKAIYDCHIAEVPRKNNFKEKHEKRNGLAFSTVTSLSLPYTDYEEMQQKLFEFEKEKLYCLQLKIKHLLEVIKFHIDDFRQADTPEEGQKLQKKAFDFVARFSRNYSYQIELEFNHVMNFKDKTKLTGIQRDVEFVKLLVKYYQILYQAFVMFQRHMHVIWRYDGTIEKLNDLVKNTMDSSEVFNSVSEVMKSSLYSALHNYCIILLERMKNLKSVRYPYSHSSGAKMRRATSATTQKVNKKLLKINNSKEKYSMYYEKPIPKRRPTSRPTSVMSNLLSMRNSHGQSYYHQNCHSSSFYFKKLESKHVENKNNAKPLILFSGKRLQNKNENTENELKSSSLRKMPINKFKYPVHIDPKTKTDKECDKNVKLLTVKHKEILDGAENRTKLVNSNKKSTEDVSKVDIDSLNKPIQLSKQTSLEECVQSHHIESSRNTPKSNSNKNNVEKIDKLSNELVESEIHSITKEMEARFDHFIRNEVEDYFNFLDKINITKR